MIACNTASAFALDEVRDEFGIPILGVIEPGARVAAQETKNKKVGVIGTEGTIGSGIHAAFLRSLGSGDHCDRQGMSPVRPSGGGGMAP